ncbi:unnamed protein product [Allacma fusca]|uniref:Centrosomin n=1 Tax=Allacma fusca TaxID=39272 RepID=A0A8J2P8E5_9HEXA|nr:unnamed protein product [Allacma fusca]
MEDEDAVLNVADGRCPTLNDLYAKIKHLEADNFQLRVRIYVNEQLQSGGSVNKFDPNSKNELVKEYTSMKRQKEDAEQMYNAIKNKNEELEQKLSEIRAPTQAKAPINEKVFKDYEEKVANMTRALVDIGAKCKQLEADNKFFTEQNLSMKSRFAEMVEENQKEIRAEQLKYANLAEKLRLAEEQLERVTKESEISMTQQITEKQIKDRQIQVQNQQMGNLLVDNQILVERLNISEEALKMLHQEHSKLVIELRNLKASYSAHVLAASRQNELSAMQGEKCEVARQDTSPDLGIESGHEAPSNENVYAENAMLRNYNRQLVLKLQQTRQALDKTVNRLSTTTKHKEQVEKAVCRQLHKTHSILKEAKQSLEKKQSQQVLTDLLPPSV